MSKEYCQVFLSLRKKNNYTQQQVAEMLKITQRAYAHYEKGDNEPSIDTLIQLAEIYKVPIDVLVGRYKMTE